MSSVRESWPWWIGAASLLTALLLHIWPSSSPAERVSVDSPGDRGKPERGSVSSDQRGAAIGADVDRPQVANVPDAAVAPDCGAITELVVGDPDQRRVDDLLALLPRVAPACVSAVPAAWQVACVRQACVQGDAEFLPSGWALAALFDLAQDQALVRGQSGIAACVRERAFAASAAETARFLQERCAGAPPILWRGAVDENLLAVFRSIAERRHPGDSTWWRPFWRALGGSGEIVRSYLYEAVGGVHGFNELRDFVAMTVEWEDLNSEVGPAVATNAGMILSRFRGNQIPGAHELVPRSARMRQVMLFSVPVRHLAQPGDVGWYGRPEMEGVVQSAWKSSLEAGGSEEANWRAAFVGNVWVLAGHEVAMRRLRAVFYDPDEAPAESATIPAVSDDAWAHLWSAAGACAAIERKPGVAAARESGAIESLLKDILGRRVSTRALEAVLLRFGTRLSNAPRRRDVFARVLQDRIADLSPKVSGFLVN